MAMVNIGTSKQLFFDDYLIESLTNAKQGLNPAVKPYSNPVLLPERPWEGTTLRPNKVLFDENDRSSRCGIRGAPVRCAWKMASLWLVVPPASS